MHTYVHGSDIFLTILSHYFTDYQLAATCQRSAVIFPQIQGRCAGAGFKHQGKGGFFKR